MGDRLSYISVHRIYLKSYISWSARRLLLKTMIKNLTITLLTLLVLVGCTTELDRCIEANKGNLEYSKDEKWTLYLKEISLTQGEAMSGSQYLFFEEHYLTDFEMEVSNCVTDEVYPLMNEYDLTIKSEKEKYFAISKVATESGD